MSKGSFVRRARRRSWATHLGAIVLGAIVLTTASAAGAQVDSENAEARALFEAGRTAYDAGRFGSALDSFRRAYELSARPALLFNMGSAAERLRRDAEALDYYERYLRDVPSAENRELVQSRIEFLRDASTHPADAAHDEQPILDAPSSREGSAPAGSSDDIAGQWWLWTLIAVVVVGAAVGVGAGVAASEPGTMPPPPGNFGGVATAVTVRF
jgi:tetratricopeptide (TPR) repeat protein